MVDRCSISNTLKQNLQTQQLTIILGRQLEAMKTGTHENVIFVGEFVQYGPTTIRLQTDGLPTIGLLRLTLAQTL